MVYSRRDERLDRTFAALADPTRRSIVARLAVGDAAISDLAAPFAMSLPAVSKHVRVLVRAGLATVARDGRVRRCRFVAAPLKDAAAWVEHYRRFWESHLDHLAEFLGEASHATPTEEFGSWEVLREAQPGPARNRRSGSKSDGSSKRRPSGSSGRGRRRKS